MSKTKSTPEPAALKLKPASAYLGGLSQATVRRLIDRGELKRITAVRHILISKAELDRFLAK